MELDRFVIVLSLPNRLTFQLDSLSKVEAEQKLMIEKLSNNES